MYGKMDFYDIKGVVEHLMVVLGIGERAEYTVETELPWRHPGRTAAVVIDCVNVGYVGELHPTVAKNYNIGTKVYLAVLNMEELIKASNMVNVYKPLPKYPAITRDIAMLVKEDVTAVSYTHLDVYKRQGKGCKGGLYDSPGQTFYPAHCGGTVPGRKSGVPMRPL